MNELWVVVVNCLVVGSAWGHLKSGQKRAADDLSSIRKSLGLENGQPGAFIRRTEWEIADREHLAGMTRLAEELAELRRRVDD